MRKKALLAIAFASGLLTSQQVALAAPKYESKDSVVQKISNDAQMTPEFRAQYLIMIARDYLTGSTKSQIEDRYGPILKEPSGPWFRRPQMLENNLTSYAQQVSVDEGDVTNKGANAKTESKSGSQSVTPENLALANEAIKSALAEADKTPNKFAKLHVYYIASRLYQKAGNTDGMRKCNEVVDDTLKSCEGTAPTEEAQTKAAISILDAQAFGRLPVHVQERRSWQEPAPVPVKPFAESKFKESEKLKLRALAMADRLPQASHVRRKAHRDLALWYLQLGKVDKADKEKQAVFKLVGVTDDKILFPQNGGCGRLVWWKQETLHSAMACGMG